MAEPPPALDAEDAKLVTLARAARARTGAGQGAALRDDTGRTYAACTVTLASLRLSAVQAAVVMAACAGAAALEAAAVVADSGELVDADRAALADLGGCPVFVADPDGTVRARR